MSFLFNTFFISDIVFTCLCIIKNQKKKDKRRLLINHPNKDNYGSFDTF